MDSQIAEKTLLLLLMGWSAQRTEKEAASNLCGLRNADREGHGGEDLIFFSKSRRSLVVQIGKLRNKNRALHDRDK